MGLERLSFLAADVGTEAFHRPGGWTHDCVAAVALAADDLPQLAEELTALERDCAADLARGYICESPEKLRCRLYEYFRALVGRGGFPPVRCNAPWVSTVMETEINLPFLTADAAGPKHLTVKLSRSQFEKLANPIIERSKAPCNPT